MGGKKRNISIYSVLSRSPSINVKSDNDELPIWTFRLEWDGEMERWQNHSIMQPTTGVFIINVNFLFTAKYQYWTRFLPLSQKQREKNPYKYIKLSVCRENRVIEGSHSFTDKKIQDFSRTP